MLRMGGFLKQGLRPNGAYCDGTDNYRLIAKLQMVGRINFRPASWGGGGVITHSCDVFRKAKKFRYDF